MGKAAASDVIDSQRYGGGRRPEHRGLIADAPDMSVERFAGKAWVSGDIDPQSLTDAVSAIERLWQVKFTAPRIVELTCAADVRNTCAAPARCDAHRPPSLSKWDDAIDPTAFDW